MVALSRYIPLLLITSGIAFVLLVYFPGLTGPWLIDDDVNLGVFKAFTSEKAPYAEIIWGNASGPLGRPVSMASFAINHFLGLFDTPSLKATNLLLHISNGCLLYYFLLRLMQRKNPTIPTNIAPTMAAIITVWWLLLPLHISSVLYIVQRMTLLASFFSLATCLLYTIGREKVVSNKYNGLILIGVSLFILLPLATLAKESAFVTLAWIVLIELFFFNPPALRRLKLRTSLATLVVLVIVISVLLIAIMSINESYAWRNFTLVERLLTQPRVIWSYILDIFLPSSVRMGVFHDDFPISRSILSPWTTLLATIGLVGLLGLAIRLSDTRWWAISFGILFYLSGHLIESTFLPLEIYFEHRNYLPSVGLLVSAAALVIMIWPWRTAFLATFFFIYLGLLTFATLQRNNIWSNKSLLLETSAINHPKSLRAWTDYSEDLLSNHKPKLALEAALTGASLNPEFMGIFHIQMISIYCRIMNTPPSSIIDQTARDLLNNNNYSTSFTTPLSIGLENILAHKVRGNCKDAVFLSLAPALIHIDHQLARHYGPQLGNQWLLRLTISEWLIETGYTAQAITILRDTWKKGDKSNIPMVGLILARTLTKEKIRPEALQVLADLATVTHDAPTDFKDEMALLKQLNTGAL